MNVYYVTCFYHTWLFCLNNILYALSSSSPVFQTDFYFFNIATYYYNITVFITMIIVTYILQLLYFKLFWDDQKKSCLISSFSNNFYLLCLLFYCMFLRVLANPYLVCLSNIFTRLFFVKIELANITFLLFQCNCCNYIFTALHFHFVPFVSDT